MNATQTNNGAEKMKSQVSPTLVAKMTKRYGTLDAARDAYREVRAAVRSHNASPAGLLGGKVVWVASDGSLLGKYASEIFYDRSPDAPFALPS